MKVASTFTQVKHSQSARGNWKMDMAEVSKSLTIKIIIMVVWNIEYSIKS